MTKKEKLAALQAELAGIQKKAKDEKRERTAEENTRVDAIITESRSLEADIQRDTEVEELEKRLTEPQPRRSGITEPSTNSLGMPDKDYSRYNLNRAINLCTEKRALDGVEAEVHQELLKRGAQNKNGGF